MCQTSTQRATAYCSLWCLVGILTLCVPSYAAAADTAVLAKTESETPGMRVEVQELKRNSDGTVTLKFAMINDQEKRDEYRAIHIYLIDGVHKKKYLVVKDARGTPVSSGKTDIAPKSRINLWATFPAPPENVQKLTVVVPRFIPMDDVPISQ